MRLKFLLAALLLTMSGAAFAQTPDVRLVPLGYCQLTSIDAATKLSTCAGGIPTGAVVAYLSAETQAIRYRDDGVVPTATVGMPIAVTAPLFYSGTLTTVQVISQVAGAKLNVLFYRY